jgi:hypothetical protein
VKRLRSRIAAAYPLDFNRTFFSLILIVGSARSGTTWLAEVLNADNDYRVIFEPLHDRFGVLRQCGLPRYIRPDNDDPELMSAVGAVLLGRFKSDRWTGRLNARIISSSRIVKDVQSNLRIGWMRAQFPDFPIVLIVRHPLATAASRLRAGFHQPFDRHIDDLLEDRLLVDDHLGPMEAELRRLTTDFEWAIARWCIETYVPLRQSAVGNRIAVLFYEHLVMDPDKGIEDIFRAVRREPPAAAYERFSVPSRSSFRGDRPLRSPADAISEWQNLLTTEQIERGLELVATFGLDKLYGPEIEPRLPNFPAGMGGSSSECWIP